MKSPTPCVLTLLMLFLLGHPAAAATIIVTVGDNFYSPKTVSIHPGDVVTWQYAADASATHPTASDNGAWATFTINSASPSHSQTFPAAGAFPYHCTFHGGPGTGMSGSITVAVGLAAQPAQLAAAAFSVYPNPATSSSVTLRLDASQVRAYPLLVQVFSPLGGLVRSVPMRPEEADRGMSVSVADLSAGLYFYRLLANNQVVATQRLLLVR